MSHVNHRAGRGAPHRAPGLLPAPGQERTFALLIAGTPLLLIALIGFWPSLSSEEAGSGATGTDGYSYAPPFDEPSADDPWGDAPSEPEVSAEGDTSLWGPSDTTGPTESADPTDSADPTTSQTPDQQADDPGTTVTRYFEAINARDFQTAWELGGKNFHPDYASFRAGFATTERDVVTINSVEGDTVSVDLRAELTDGTQESYSGTYTVVDGVITAASMTRTG
ncbi:hypothetical protein ACIBBD_02885 [Streptomyces sp. NPDC051315]|uniref:hypothetical protein n=1 Tax=Streptomyces sp. NPDC051315 TaxID=3365650 RepID=UPI0037B05C9D